MDYRWFFGSPTILLSLTLFQVNVEMLSTENLSRPSSILQVMLNSLTSGLFVHLCYILDRFHNLFHVFL